eukprot:3753819-Rhodomonas_salina.3
MPAVATAGLLAAGLSLPPSFPPSFLCSGWGKEDGDGRMGNKGGGGGGKGGKEEGREEEEGGG